MTNKDLIKQYVNTGLQLPPYQIERLNNNEKQSYYRTRLNMVRANPDEDYYELSDEEINLMPENIFMAYVERRLKDYKPLEYYEVKGLSDRYKRLYFELFISIRQYINNSDYILFPEYLKNQFLLNRIKDEKEIDF